MTEFTRSALVGAVRLSPPNDGADDSEVRRRGRAIGLVGQVRFVARSRAFIRSDSECRPNLEKGQRAACQVKFEKTEASIAAEVKAIREAAKERMTKGKADLVQRIEQGSVMDRKTDSARAKMAGTNRQTNGSE